MFHLLLILCFFFNDPATTEIYTLSLHDALPISRLALLQAVGWQPMFRGRIKPGAGDRKRTRLNSSHRTISYDVFCSKKKKKRISCQACKKKKKKKNKTTQNNDRN